MAPQVEIPQGFSHTPVGGTKWGPREKFKGLGHKRGLPGLFFGVRTRADQKSSNGVSNPGDLELPTCPGQIHWGGFRFSLPGNRPRAHFAPGELGGNFGALLGEQFGCRTNTQAYFSGTQGFLKQRPDPKGDSFFEPANQNFWGKVFCSPKITPGSQNDQGPQDSKGFSVV